MQANGLMTHFISLFRMITHQVQLQVRGNCFQIMLGFNMLWCPYYGRKLKNKVCVMVFSGINVACIYVNTFSGVL